MKHFPNLQTKAAAYAALKDLERMLKEDGEIPPGFKTDLSGVKVTCIEQASPALPKGRKPRKATNHEPA